MKKVFVFIISTFFSIGLLAQTSTPKYSNEFLSIGVDARALAMSKSVVAGVDDVTAGYWNPAGLVNMKEKFGASLMHSAYFAGVANFDYAAFAFRPDSSSALGVSLIRFGIDDIPDTRFLYDANGALNYDRIQFFSAADYGLLLSYARTIPKLKNLKLGANFKIVHRSVGDFANAWGFGLDAGIQYSIGKWNLGAMARDISGTFNAWTHNTAEIEDIYLLTGNEIPSNSIEITLPRLILGVSRTFAVKEHFSIMTEANAELTFDGKRNTIAKSDFTSLSPRLGMELGYKQRIYARLGVGEFQQVKQIDNSEKMTFQPNFGLGINIKGLNIDYALTDIGNQAEALYSHVFSLKYGWSN